jgi:NADH-quinone oxidoreductase subunit N
LAVGSKAAGIVLLLRILFTAVPGLAEQWSQVLVAITAATILYGNLCAIPQRNLKRLLGYSSIANAGYLLLGITAANSAGSVSVLFYLTGYLFSVIAAFTVISVVTRQSEDEDISVLAGLHQRSPLLATSLSLAMISLAGIPPLAGFFGKFLLLKSVIERGGSQPLFLFLLAAALFGVVVSFYYYLGVVRAIYWSKTVSDTTPIAVSAPLRAALYVCSAAMLFLGIYPEPVLNMAANAVAFFKF